jgi:2-polyprenyl-3-methyl-5-hydroxy-6-metoxy-1,4-benzoquinol methylase
MTAADKQRRSADMSEYDRNVWDERWSQALREHGDRVAQRPPNAHLTGEVGDLRRGRALDAGCGHGSDTLWLAARGWQVTAVDFAATALAYARSTAEAMGPDVAERIDWIEAHLATWTPQRDEYDLVVCPYGHVAGSVEEMVERMATGVACGGTLFRVWTVYVLRGGCVVRNPTFLTWTEALAALTRFVGTEMVCCCPRSRRVSGPRARRPH